MEIDFAKIEKKWQDAWEKEKVFEVSEGKKKKYYVLEMFPYPSGTGIHMGHAFNYILGDILSRFKIMQGFNVLHPTGFDSLGLPAENAAIKDGTHPADYTNKSIPNFMKQQKGLGLSYDWSRMINTADASYYKWDQWIFLKMFEKGLAYQKTSAVNWCRKCNTVLANEQVHDGRCWRHDDCEVEIRQLKQWFLKTTEYADELYENLDKMDWPEKTKAMQRNWIGKSQGTEIDFEVSNVKKVILLHGKDTNPKDKWYPWFVEQIKNRGVNALCPELPESEDPEIRKWLEEIEKTNPDEDSVLVGHSRGGVAILRWLEKLPKGKKIKKVILIGTNSGDSAKMDVTENNKGFFAKKGYDFEKIKSHCDSFVVIHSRDDHVVPFSAGEENAEGLDAKFKVYEGKRHFGNKEAPEIPEALEEIFEKWSIFTTRPDTIFGVTFMVVAAQHSKLDSLVTSEQRKDVDKFLKKLKSVSGKDVGDLEKEGVFTGSYAVNPANGEKVPVYAGNFVVADYGSGMVMAVPAHDQRDFEFAKKYGIEIKTVIKPERTSIVTITKSLKKEFYESVKGIGEISENDGLSKIYTEDVDKVFELAKENFVGAPWYIHSEGKIKKVLMHSKKDDKVFDWSDEVENESAKKFGLNIGIKEEQLDYDELYRAYTDKGDLINSGEFNGLENVRAKHNITEWLIEERKGRRITNFKLRDWGISRQRYWGTPIPVIHCEKCGAVAVPEKDLPIELPKDVKFGKGNPLETNEGWLNVKCPECGGKGRRESDTMDTFANSSWYFLRYCDPKNDKKIFDVKKVKYWCPIDTYIGGAEHACMHLIYSRFYVKFLRDIGLVDFDEPAVRLFHQGMINGSDGEKMSKSKGNGVEPLETMEKYGVDTTRLFLVSVAAPDKGFDWSEKSINGSLRFIKRIITYFNKVKFGKDSEVVLAKLNRTLKNVSDYYENFTYRKATIELRELFDLIEKEKVSRETLEKFLQMLSPICPHICEEFWAKLGNKDFISTSDWPKADEKKVQKKGEAVDLNGKIVDRIKEIVRENTEKIYVYVMPFELDKIDIVKISKAVGGKVKVFAVNDSNKHDPENKARKAKPGKVAIYLE